METKPRVRRRKPIHCNEVVWLDRHARDYPLLASTKLEPELIRLVIRCYAYRLTPAQAQAATGLSHVTIYRIYGHIRRRMELFMIHPSMDTFIDTINDGEEEGQPYFDWEELRAFMKTSLGKRRGIKPTNRATHQAELLGRFMNRYPPGRLYRAILKSVRAAGPLNREPRPELAARGVNFLNKTFFDNYNNSFHSQKSTTRVLYAPAELPPGFRRRKPKPRSSS